MGNKFRPYYSEELGESDGQRQLHFKLRPEIGGYIDRYFSIDFYGKKVATPYFINTKRRRDLRALMGKGTPNEIELETKVWAQVKGFDLKSASIEEIRAMMAQVGIGIDCSGLVVHSMHGFLRKRGFNIFTDVTYRYPGIRQWLARQLRPAENLGADDLTNEHNCDFVEVKDVCPGDFIRGIGRQRNAYHIAIVSDVIEKDGVVTEIRYVHSHRRYGTENGMRRGVVKVIDEDKGFLEQDWREVHADGRNYLYEDLTVEPENSGFRRLKVLNL